MTIFSTEHYHAGARFRFDFESTGDTAAFTDDAMRRILCHELIERIPAEALPEIWENIYETWQYFCRPRLAAPTSSTLLEPGVRANLGLVEESSFRVVED